MLYFSTRVTAVHILKAIRFFISRRFIYERSVTNIRDWSLAYSFICVTQTLLQQVTTFQIAKSLLLRQVPLLPGQVTHRPLLPPPERVTISNTGHLLPFQRVTNSMQVTTPPLPAQFMSFHTFRTGHQNHLPAAQVTSTSCV